MKKKLNFLDEIAKKAFNEVMIKGISKITTLSPLLPTIHLQTDTGRKQNKRPGVYIIQHRETGACIVGQTKDLRKRFNQYTSRSKNIDFTTTNKINKNFYQAVQKIPANIDYSQVFQRYVVYTWVNQNGKALDIQNCLKLKNEMNYLEHRLILEFFECGLTDNFEDVGPQFMENVVLHTNSGITNRLPRDPAIQTGHQAKPFKIENHYFYSSVDYEKFRKSLGNKTGKFIAMPSLRKKLLKNTENINSDVRYLNRQEIDQAFKEGLFYNRDSQ